MRTAAAGVALVIAAATLAHGAAWGDWRDSVVLTLSERLRGEFVDWFRPPPGTVPAGAQRYSFLGSRLRVGATVTLPHFQLVLQAQDTQFANLPDDAAGLGPGALYFLHTHDTTQGEVFLKLGFLTFRQRGFTATGGRFEYADGLETEPANPTLAFLDRFRIAERLIGPLSYSHVSRSFDGGRVAYDQPAWNLTAMAARPTQGGFEVSANQEIAKVEVAGLAATLKRLPIAPPATLRVFYLYYGDGRRDTVKVDNRPESVRQRDKDAISVNSFGGNAMTVVDLPPGAVDILLWAVLQSGAWGTLNHFAWAYAAEAGYQLPRLEWTPWLRAGCNRTSGDDDPTDGRHGTFFQLLPTARQYAQFPFFNLMNTTDVFAQLIVFPLSRLTVRTDYHWLALTERQDLWYSGSGATKTNVFGYTGAPSGGARPLAHLVDVSAGIEVMKHVTLNAYYGHAFGERVVQASFAGADADYAYVEMLLGF
jgi:alginate export protein